MTELGAAGTTTTPYPVNPMPKSTLNSPGRDAAAVGWKLAVFFVGCQCWCPGELLAFNCDTGQHHICYVDGQDEWLDLSAEQLEWCQEPGPHTFCCGLPQGTLLPALAYGRLSVLTISVECTLRSRT